MISVRKMEPVVCIAEDDLCVIPSYYKSFILIYGEFNNGQIKKLHTLSQKLRC